MVMPIHSKSTFVQELLRWYRSNKRSFPWRYVDNPYRVWLAEALLQRTRAELVEREYCKILEKYPDVFSLAKAPLAEIKQIIWPLGLTHRVHYLKKAARHVAEKLDGRFPENIDQLRDIPGAGDYVANAILLFAFNKRALVVDVNVVRLLTRVFDTKSSKKRPHTDPVFRELLTKIMPNKRYQDFMYAVLDFASLVCAKTPKCAVCPLTRVCLWFKSYGLKDGLGNEEAREKRVLTA